MPPLWIGLICLDLQGSVGANNNVDVIPNNLQPSETWQYPQIPGGGVKLDPPEKTLENPQR